MTSEESICNLIRDLCYHHLYEVRKISHKKHFPKLRSLSYETLFLFLNAKKLRNTPLNSYEKMLCHISDLKIKGFKVQADKLSLMVEKIVEGNRNENDEVLNIFTLLISLFNSGETEHPISKLLADNLSESKHLSWGSTAYACFIEKDFIVHDQLLKLPSLKQFEEEPLKSYKNFEEVLAFGLERIEATHGKVEDVEDHQCFTTSHLGLNIWQDVVQFGSKSERFTWEEVGRRGPPLEPPFLTECKNARSHVDRSSNSLSNSEARVASRFEDSIDDVVDILLGIPDELISRTPVFNGDTEKCTILTNSCEEFLVVGSAFNELLQFCDSLKRRGPLCTSLCEAIHSYLVLYNCAILSLKHHCTSVLHVSFKSRSLFKQLRFLVRLCRFEPLSGSEHPKSSLLLSYLYAKCVEVEDDDDLHPLLLHLFRSVCIPYLKMLESWIYLGKSQTEEGQFIVNLNPDALASRDEQFWLDGVARADVPCFFDDVGDTITNCGKSVNLLRTCTTPHSLATPSLCSEHPPLSLVLTKSSLKSYQNLHRIYVDTVLEQFPRAGLADIPSNEIQSTDDLKIHPSSPSARLPRVELFRPTTKEIYLENVALDDACGDAARTRGASLSNKLSHVAVTSQQVTEEQDDAMTIKKAGSIPAHEDSQGRFIERSGHLYIPHRKQVEGSHVTLESGTNEYANSSGMGRTHIKSVHGAHPSMHSIGFPLGCFSPTKEEAIISKCSDGNDDNSASITCIENKELCSEQFRSLSKSYSNGTLESSGYSSCDIDSDIFTNMETDIFTSSSKRITNHGVYEKILDLCCDIKGTPLCIWIRESLIFSISLQSSLVDQALMNYFFNVVHIHKYFDLFQKYVMLQDAQFASDLVERLSRGLYVNDESDHSLYHHKEIFNPSYLNFVLQCALTSTSCLNSELTSKLSFIILDDSLKSTSDSLSYLSLTLVVDWPACIVVQKRHLNAYKSLFAFLFKLKRVLWSVNEIFMRLKRDASIFLGGQQHNKQFQQLHLFRHNMQHFVRSVHDYVNDQVLTVSWREFHERMSFSKNSEFVKMKDVRNLDELIGLHTKFVEECLSGCLLEDKSSSIMSIIDALFDHVILFQSQLKSDSWISTGVEIKGRSDNVFHPKYKVLFDTHKKFQEAFGFLRRILVKLESKSCRPHLSDLLMRLQFN